MKYFEWQLLVENRWQRIDNDHVIEAHYCQPGAKGITINTSMGKIFIDFDTLETSNEDFRVQRLCLLPSDQEEEVGWYFRDDHLWCEYGSKGPGTSISSKDIEHHFTLYPQGSLRFTVGSNGYSMDFSTMTQKNLVTGLQRNIRRRPKFPSNTAGLYTTTVLAGPTQLSAPGSKWEFMGDQGQWTEYQAHICSCDSSDIEREYKLNPQGKLHFTTHKYSYTLDFSRMCQVNHVFGTTRAVRRTAGSRVQPGNRKTRVAFPVRTLNSS
ncbi:poly [ADP-ribose] polymerase 12 isoform X1 [Oryzias latipes]|uniref:poly [ADP-ribose] polymerase 12 isoform X1 n=1 Tax=Oryzias latipes TaxID=8090 RepID=UPI0005CBB22F|nr:poly [ADP-ribose] polymerase 12 isoform X1 [Oryzias latipes]XP_020569737.1 poly [ADP-ribose] polymerase 12 isoform X1 [Oryzias latipes]XP_020569739.1 poly [ADP-ribose] polymerase 12 isoform X1 [Oryzias latipes]